MSERVFLLPSLFFLLAASGDINSTSVWLIEWKRQNLHEALS